MRNWYGALPTAILLALTSNGAAEVTAADDDGFQIRIIRTVQVELNEIDGAIIRHVSDWWDPAHTFSGDSQNLSMDLEHRRFSEALPDGGFVSHMEIVHYTPRKTLRLLGGLGPLQEMGLHGALTFQWKKQEDSTIVTLTYNVTGYASDGLQSLAPVVDGVLAAQLDRLCAYVAETE
jgi:hypothetical protein